MTYDFDLKFETELEVTVGDKALNDMFDQLNMPRLEKSSRAVVEHKISITNSATIPTQDVIEQFKKTVFECVSDAFNKKADKNSSTKVIETRFVGIINLVERK